MTDNVTRIRRLNDELRQHLIGGLAVITPGRISTPGNMSVIGRRGDRQDFADRLDPMRRAVIVNEGDHGLNRRSSSAWAK